MDFAQAGRAHNELLRICCSDSSPRLARAYRNPISRRSDPIAPLQQQRSFSHHELGRPVCQRYPCNRLYLRRWDRFKENLGFLKPPLANRRHNRQLRRIVREQMMREALPDS
jgi:hypothetical protein